MNDIVGYLVPILAALVALVVAIYNNISSRRNKILEDQLKIIYSPLHNILFNRKDLDEQEQISEINKIIFRDDAYSLVPDDFITAINAEDYEKCKQIIDDLYRKTRKILGYDHVKTKTKSKRSHPILKKCITKIKTFKIFIGLLFRSKRKNKNFNTASRSKKNKFERIIIFPEEPSKKHTENKTKRNFSINNKIKNLLSSISQKGWKILFSVLALLFLFGILINYGDTIKENISSLNKSSIASNDLSKNNKINTASTGYKTNSGSNNSTPPPVETSGNDSKKNLKKLEELNELLPTNDITYYSVRPSRLIKYINVVCFNESPSEAIYDVSDYKGIVNFSISGLNETVPSGNYNDNSIILLFGDEIQLEKHNYNTGSTRAKSFNIDITDINTLKIKVIFNRKNVDYRRLYLYSKTKK